MPIPLGCGEFSKLTTAIVNQICLDKGVSYQHWKGPLSKWKSKVGEKLSKDEEARALFKEAY